MNIKKWWTQNWALWNTVLNIWSSTKSFINFGSLYWQAMKHSIHKALPLEVCDQCNQSLSKCQLKVLQIYFLYLLLFWTFQVSLIDSAESVELQPSTQPYSKKVNCQYYQTTAEKKKLNFSYSVLFHMEARIGLKNFVHLCNKQSKYLDNWLYINFS